MPDLMDDVQRARWALGRLARWRADDREQWIHVGMALQTVSDELFQDWDDWSRQSDAYQEGETTRQWRSFKARGEGDGVTIGSLLHMAREDSGEQIPRGGDGALDRRSASAARPKRREPKVHPTLEAAMRAMVHGLDNSKAAKREGWGYKPSQSWVYVDRQGDEVARIVRFDAEGVAGEAKRQAKQYRPIRRSDDGTGYQVADPRGKWPLYNLPELCEQPDGIVLAVEGEKCVDAASGIGVLATTSAHGAQSAGKTDWAPLAGRRVALVPDNDPDGAGYATAVRSYLLALTPPAEVIEVALPGLPAKGDLADWIAQRKGQPANQIREELMQLVCGEPESDDEDNNERDAQAANYRMHQQGILRLKTLAGGDQQVIPLTNFQAEIVREISRDDGMEVSTLYEIEAKLGSRVARVQVPAAKYGVMDWVAENLGPMAVIYPGQAQKDHARVAIQLMSGEVPRSTVYGQLGWREIDGRNVYLHAGGGIDADGPTPDVEVNVASDLMGMALPAPVAGGDLHQAIHDSFAMLQLGLDAAPAATVWSSYAAVWRAPLGRANFCVHIAGSSGSGKSLLARLLTAHWWPDVVDAERLPAAWHSTPNSVEALGFEAADALMVIDDFKPEGSQVDVARAHTNAARLIRGAGNQSGRQRMNADGTLRPTKWLRCLALSTGEEVPRGESINARMLVLEHHRMADRPELIEDLQYRASSGAFARAMASYVQWLARDLAGHREDHAARVLALRQSLSSSSNHLHRRTPRTLAELQAGFERFLRFAVECGAFPQDNADAQADWCWQQLLRAGAEQAMSQHDADPVARFVAAVQSILSVGRGHIQDNLGEHAPTNAAAWGWRWDYGLDQYVPSGPRLGWLHNGEVLLEAMAVYNAVSDELKRQGTSLGLGSTQLGKRLLESGILLSVDAGRTTKRVTLGGARPRVYPVAIETIQPQGDSNG